MLTERIISRRRPNRLIRATAYRTRGGGQVKQISIFVFGLVTAFASASALAQDFTAGKTPAQLFSSDCAECHRSPNGLGKNRDVRALASFLREHYTTKSESASALAAYVSGFAGSGTAAHNRSAGTLTPASGDVERPRAERRKRSEAEATATGEDAHAKTKSTEDLPGRRRRTNNLSGDDEKRRASDDGEVQRPPRSLATRPATAKSDAPARGRAMREATDPTSRLRSYLSSGLGYESATAEAARKGAPKSRKRRNSADTVEAPASDVPTDVPTTAKTDAEAPSTASPPATTDAAASATPSETTGAPAPAASPPASPRSEP